LRYGRWWNFPDCPRIKVKSTFPKNFQKLSIARPLARFTDEANLEMKRRADMTMQTNNPAITVNENSRWTKPGTNYLLWTIQALLAALFVFAGGMKLALPIEAMTRQMPLPGWFLRFIGVAEVLGATGLILPWFFGLKRALTPLAASGLVIIMLGATVLTLEGGSIGGVVMPFVVGVLLSLVAYGRWAGLRATAANGEAHLLAAQPSTIV